MPSVYEQALNAVATQLTALGVTALFTDPVQVRALDWEDVVKLGGLTVRYDPDGIAEDQRGTNLRDHWGYPCHVIHCQGAHVQLLADVSAIWDYFQLVTRHFHNRRTMSAVSDTGTNELLTTTTRLRVPKRHQDKLIRGLTVHAWFLEPREA